MSDNDARQALEALLRDGEGLSDADLDVLIVQELNKGDGMDADLVVEVVNEAEGVQQPFFDAAANWAAIVKKLNLRKQTGTSRRWAAAAAVVAIFTLVTVGTITTEAWRWDILIKIFSPVLDTMGIHMRVEDVGSVEILDGLVISTSSPLDEKPEVKSQAIHDERQVPETVQGIEAKPSWLPEGYTFHSAQVYKDFNESSLTITYRKGTSELFVQTVVYTSDSTLTVVNVLEKDVQEAEVTKAITIVENNGVITAIHEHDLTFYIVWGRLSREDISSVITSML